MPKTSSTIEMAEFKLVTTSLHLIGTAPLIAHAFPEKARKEMLGKQMKQAKPAREARDPFAEVEASRYRLRDGRDGMPAIAFKNAAVTACTSIADVTKVAARQAFRVAGEASGAEGVLEGSFVRTALVPLVAGAPRIREDVARIGTSGTEMRYRPEYDPWGAVVEVTFNPSVVSVDQLASMFNAAGHGVGIGDYRPERNGDCGTFAVVDAKTFDDWRKDHGL